MTRRPLLDGVSLDGAPDNQGTDNPGRTGLDAAAPDPETVDRLVSQRVAAFVVERKRRREADAQTRAALEGRRRVGLRARHTRKLARSAQQQANATVRAGKRGGRR